MGALPFLVVHGAWVWKLLVAAGSVGTLAASTAVRTASARRAKRRMVRERLGALTGLEPGPVRLRATVRGGAIATLRQVGTELVHEYAEPDAYVEHGETRVALAGPVRVVAGTRERAAMLGPPRETPVPLRQVAGTARRWSLATVAPGDEVIVDGVLVAMPPTDGGYRDGAPTWKLEPADGAPIEVAAVTPTGRAKPRTWPAAIAALGVVALCWYGVLHKVGTIAADRATDWQERTTRTEIPPFGALAIAAAMPGSRIDALEGTARSFSHLFAHTADTLPILDALDELIDVCWAADDQLREVRLDAALASAQACGNRAFEARVQLFRGEYAAVLALHPENPSLRLTAAIAVGDWKGAATAADEVAAADEGPDHGGYLHAEYAAVAAIKMRCLGALARVHAGETAAFDQLRVPADSEAAPTCALLRAIVERDPEQRRVAIEAVRRQQDALPYEKQDTSLKAKTETFLALAGGTADRVWINDLGTSAFELQGEAWLLAHDPDNAFAQLATTLRAGDFRTAHAKVPALGSDPDDILRDSLLTELALADGTELPVIRYEHPALRAAIEARRGTAVHDDELTGAYPESCEPELVAAVNAAIAGDGADLARVLGECHVYEHFVRQLVGVLPRVHQHRAELAAALRVARDDLTTYSVENVPFRLVDTLSHYRDLARLAGDDAEATALQATISRHLVALRSLDRAAALLFITR